MRLLLVVIGALLATQAQACSGAMPPASMQLEPTVPYEIFHVRGHQLSKFCGNFHYGCAYHAPTTKQPDRWAIVVNDDVPFDEAACTIIYEKAHLPPNYWADPTVESSGVIADLARMKSTKATH